MKYRQVISLITAAVSAPLYATSVDLDFSNHIESTNLSTWAGPSYDGTVIHFLNVGTHNGKTIDAKVSSEVFGDATFLFHTPDYKEGPDQPDGDIGFLLSNEFCWAQRVLSIRSNFMMELTGYLARFQNLIPFPEFDMIGYDIDGEPVQSEQVRVFKSEGFYSYQTGSAGARLTAEESEDGDSVLFSGPGTNYSETDTSGAVKFTFKNTSIVTLTI